MLTLELKFPASQFAGLSKKIVNEMKKAVRNRIETKKDSISAQIKARFIYKIRHTTEYGSLTRQDGILRKELGIEYVGAVKAILDLLVDNIKIQVGRASTLSGDYVLPVRIILIDEDWNGVLQSEAASYLSVNAKGNVTEIPWFRWIVGETQPFVFGYRLVLGDFSRSDFSRTQRALMYKGGSWTINSNYKVGDEDNFITQAASEMEDEIEKIVLKEIA